MITLSANFGMFVNESTLEYFSIVPDINMTSKMKFGLFMNYYALVAFQFWSLCLTYLKERVHTIDFASLYRCFSQLLFFLLIIYYGIKILGVLDIFCRQVMRDISA